ncbi:MAG: putative ABC transporter permease [Anaerovoracaceae bacterium]
MIIYCFVEFIICSFLGWLWESFYCTIRERHWADRGFLFGPICPIYGSCVILLLLLFNFLEAHFPREIPAWGIFLICFFGSAIAEYGTSYVLEKRYHMRWWDYGYMPLNINGRICLPVSIAFGLTGVLTVNFVLPQFELMHEKIPFAVYELSAIVFAMIFGADFALTEAGLSSLLKNVNRMHEEFNEKAQNTYIAIAEAPKKIGEKIIEAPKLVDESHIKLEKKARSIASRYALLLNYNQRRIIKSIKKFSTHRKSEQDKLNLQSPINYLKEEINKLRTK